MFIEFANSYINTKLIRYITTDSNHGSLRIVVNFSKKHEISEFFGNWNNDGCIKRFDELIDILNGKILEKE